MSATPKTFVVVENGVETVHEMSPEMQRVHQQMAAFNERHPDFWCHCENPDAVTFDPRGHSVDVFCRCGGCLQVG